MNGNVRPTHLDARQRVLSSVRHILCIVPGERRAYRAMCGAALEGDT